MQTSEGTTRPFHIKPMLAVAFALLVSWCLPASAADLSKPLILVAQPELRDELYGATILVVAPIGDDEHVGFIVNRSTGVALGSLLRDEDAPKKVTKPVYVGGPYANDAIFALVQRRESPEGKSFEVMPGLFAALDQTALADVVRSEPEHAKFLAGLVVWRPGELDTEVERGAWYVLEPDAALAMREPQGLWEELVQRLNLSADAI